MGDKELEICKEKILDFEIKDKIIFLKEDIEYKSWKIDKKIPLYTFASGYKYNFKNYFVFRLIDSNGDSREFRMYFIKLYEEFLTSIQNALTRIPDRSEFSYANWTEYDAKEAVLKKEITDLCESVTFKLNAGYSSSTILEISDKLTAKIKEWEIYKNDFYYYIHF